MAKGLIRRILGIIPLRCYGVEHIRNGNDPGLKRDLISDQTIGISSSVHFFMMKAGDFRHAAKIARKVKLIQNDLGFHGMSPHFFPILGCV